MTEDRDFKRLVRERAAATGEPYQAARRALRAGPGGPEGGGGFAARVDVVFEKPAGRILGCTMERGTVARGMAVTVATPSGVQHHGVVVSLRHMWTDLESVSAGEYVEFGLLLDPPYDGPLPAHVTGGPAAAAAALPAGFEPATHGLGNRRSIP
jgi:hypothetical protein